MAIRRRHAAILGVCALIDSYPYTVEKFMPELLTNVLAEHTYDPVRFCDQLCFFIYETLAGSNIEYGSEVREQFQKDAPGYLARGL